MKVYIVGHHGDPDCMEESRFFGIKGVLTNPMEAEKLRCLMRDTDSYGPYTEEVRDPEWSVQEWDCLDSAEDFLREHIKQFQAALDALPPKGPKTATEAMLTAKRWEER